MSAVMRQGSAEWAEWRRHGIGASDVPIILGLSPWKTARELWEEKTGRREPFAGNFATRRGQAMEPIARAAYEAATGNIMEPAERTHPLIQYMRASLDGITLDGTLILEVKAPGKDAHAEAVAGRVPTYYMPQVQAQLFVADAQLAHYWSFAGTAGVLIEVRPDVAMQERIVKACATFWQHVQDDTPPEASANDERNDAAWRELAGQYIANARELETLEAAQSAIKTRMAELAPDGASGGGVTFVRIERAGTIAYAKALKQMLPDVDLEPFRGKPTTIYQTRIDK